MKGFQSWTTRLVSWLTPRLNFRDGNSEPIKSPSLRPPMNKTWSDEAYFTSIVWELLHVLVPHPLPRPPISFRKIPRDWRLAVWLGPSKKTEVDFQKTLENIGNLDVFPPFLLDFPPCLLEKSEKPGEFGGVPLGPRTSAAPNSWHWDRDQQWAARAGKHHMSTPD